jgi:hypothetical protein
MTNTKCFECSKPLTSRNANRDTSHINRMCDKCYDYAAWENTHIDEDHTSDTVDIDCPVCEELWGKVIVPIVTGRKNTSHAACTHERTAKGRAACRKLNTK